MLSYFDSIGVDEITFPLIFNATYCSPRPARAPRQEC